jgi:hypothetical protein
VTNWLSPVWLDLALGGVGGSLLGVLGVPVAAAPWWSTFPWGAVGAVVALVGLVIGALKLAVLWGKAAQRDAEHERRIQQLEGKADGVPEAVDDGVSKRYAAVESEASALRRHLARAIAELRKHDQDIAHLTWRCEANHGPLSKVQSVREDSDELLLEPPKEKDDATKE